MLGRTRWGGNDTALSFSGAPGHLRLVSGTTSLRGGQSFACFAVGTLPGSPYPRPLQCQVSLGPGEATPCLLPQPRPHSRATTRTSGPCCCRDGGLRLSHRAPLCPRKAGRSRQCLAQLGAAGREHVYRFLQRCSSKRGSRAQTRQHLTARLSLNQSNVTPLQREGF